tara:strand:+ start:16 stop:528 length:513 start_codon:yes stop_codon:yes gene_type:complete
MAIRHFNITGELTQQLLAAGDNIGVSSISLANTDSLHNGIVDLYIEKKLTGKFYLLKNVVIPPGVTLIHDVLGFDNGKDQFSMYVKLTKTTLFTLTGAINPIASTTITGVGTKFVEELSVGDEIIVSSETRTVSAISSDTSLTVSVATTNTANDTSPDCNPVAPIDIILK